MILFKLRPLIALRRFIWRTWPWSQSL